MDETRWLDEDEARAWRLLLQGSTRLLERLDRELLDAHGLTLAEYEVLSMLSEAEDRRLRMSALADVALLSRSRLTHTVDRLGARGLVERVPCPHDRRGMFASLTPAGMEAVVAAAPTHLAGVRRYLVDGLSAADVRCLASAFERSLAAVAAAEEQQRVAQRPPARRRVSPRT